MVASSAASHALLDVHYLNGPSQLKLFAMHSVPVMFEMSMSCCAQGGPD